MLKKWDKNDDFLYLNCTSQPKEVVQKEIKENVTLDSSILLYDFKCFDNFKNTRLIIPIVVFQELNKLKEQIGTEKGYYARRVIDFLLELVDLHGEGLKNGLVYGSNIIELKYISKLAKESPLNNLLVVEADELVVETARVTGSKLCSRDKEMNVLAADFVERYKYEFDVIKNEIYKGYRYIPISVNDYENINSVMNTLIKDSEINGNPYDMNPWEFALFVDEEAYDEYVKAKKARKKAPKLTVIHTAVYRPKTSKAGIGTLVSVNLDEHSRLDKITAQNQEQRMLMYLLKQMKLKNIHLLSIQGGAGRGKTLSAASFALEEIRNQQYTKMLYTKSIREIDKQEELGTVPGDEFEKFKNYVIPFYSAIEYIYRKEIHGQDTDKRSSGRNIQNKENGVTSKKQQSSTKSLRTVDEIVEEYRTRNQLVFLPLGKIRGMNLYNSLAMLDEAQNTTRHGMKSYISRLDNNSSAIIMGDNNQIDDPNLNEYNNGFSHLIEEAKDEPFIAHLTLDIDEDAVRGLLATFASSKL